LVSDQIDVAVAIGVIRPFVVLPNRWISGRSSEELQTVLAHEMAHVQNGDLGWLALGRLLLVLVWAQPLYWLLRRSLRLDQEALADAAAAEQAGRRKYAEQLVAWARGISTRPRLVLPAAMGLWEGPSQLRRRVALLLDERLKLLRDCPKRWRVAAGSMLAITAIGLSLVTLQPASQAADESQPEKEAGDRQTSLEYSGNVVDKRSDKPVAGATVVVRRQTSSTEPWKTLAETIHTTGADGRYHFTIPPEQVADSHLYIEIDVTHPDYAPSVGFGYALGMIRKNEKLGGRPFFERIPVEPADPIRGIVKTPDGQPAANMPVLAFSAFDTLSFGDFTHSWARGKTDAEGRFQLNVVKNGKAILWLLPTDYSQQTQVLGEHRGDLGTISLEDGIRLRGQVVNRDGKPIVDVWVNAELVEGPTKKSYDLAVVDAIERSALTDKQGQFELGPLPAGSCRVKIEERPGENPNRDRQPRPLPAVFVPQRVTLAADHAPEPLTIQAAETVTIEGQIFDSAGKHRGGHAVHFSGHVGDRTGDYYFAEGQPDERGHIVLRVPTGLQDAKLDLSCNEHQVLRHRRGAQGTLQSGREIDLGNLQRDWRDLEIVYYTAPALIVSARDRDGDPIDKFQPAIFYQDSVKPRRTGSRWLNGISGEVAFERQEDGRWRSEQLLPDQEFFLTVTADGYQPVTQTISLEEGAIEEIAVTFEKTRVESGD
jgi:hypothetical protein